MHNFFFLWTVNSNEFLPDQPKKEVKCGRNTRQHFIADPMMADVKMSHSSGCSCRRGLSPQIKRQPAVTSRVAAITDICLAASGKRSIDRGVHQLGVSRQRQGFGADSSINKCNLCHSFLLAAAKAEPRAALWHRGRRHTAKMTSAPHVGGQKRN